jgi:host factor-I protein
MDTEGGGIQNEFFNRARKDRAQFTVVLTNGARLIGRIRAFDKFTILLDTDHGDQMVFKHAIATVGPAAASQPA